MPQNPQKTDEPSGNPITNEYNTEHQYYTQHSNPHYKTCPTKNEQQNKANPTTRHHYPQYTYHDSRAQTHQKRAATSCTPSRHAGGIVTRVDIARIASPIALRAVSVAAPCPIGVTSAFVAVVGVPVTRAPSDILMRASVPSPRGSSSSLHPFRALLGARGGRLALAVTP